MVPAWAWIICRRLSGRPVGPDELAQPHDRRFHGRDVPARRIQVAADRHKTDQGPGRVEIVGGPFDGVAPLERGRPGRGVHPGRRPDRFGRRPGDGFRPFRRKGVHMPGQVVEAPGPFRHERPVVQSFRNDHLQQGQGQDVVRPRPEGEPEVGPLRQLGPAGVHHHEAGPGPQRAGQLGTDHALLVGGRDVAAPEDGQLGRVVEVGHRIESAGVEAGDLPGRVADILDRRHIGRSEEIGQPDQGEMLQPLGHPLAEGRGPGPVFRADSPQPVGDGRQGLVPTDGCPFSLAPFAGPPQGPAQPVGMGQFVRARRPFGTDVAAVEIPVGVAGHPDDPVVPDPYLEGAAAVIHAAAVGSNPGQVVRHIRSLSPVPYPMVWTIREAGTSCTLSRSQSIISDRTSKVAP